MATATLISTRRAHLVPGVLTVMLLAAAPVPAAAKEEPVNAFTIAGSIRVRAEAIDGQFRAVGPVSDMVVSVRTLVSAEYDFGAIRVGGELDDSRAYGESRVSTIGTSDVNALEPLQVYVALDLGHVVGRGASGALTFGRFTLDQGSGRLIARPDFSDSPPSYLGVDLDWHDKAGNRVVAFWTMPFDRLPGDATGIRHARAQWDHATAERQFFGISATKSGVLGKASLELYGYGLQERDGPETQTRNRRLGTFGGRLFLAPAGGMLDYEAEAAIQRGRVRVTTAASDLTDLAVAASFAHAEIGRTVGSGWTPRVAAVLDFASGDGPGARYGRFDPLYGSGRPDFGPTSLYGALNRPNLASVGVMLDARPSKKTDFYLKGRAVWLAQPTDSFGSSGVRDKSGRSGAFAGMQLEARARTWLLAKRLRLEGGGAWLAKGHFLEAAPNAPVTGDTHYGYMAMTASF